MKDRRLRNQVKQEVEYQEIKGIKVKEDNCLVHGSIMGAAAQNNIFRNVNKDGKLTFYASKLG